jgi:lactobin A/cerein 7B family class IIb bacteriocin
MRTLTMDEVECVSGGLGPVAIVAVRAGAGAVLGAAAAAVNEANGDGLSFSDAGKIAGAAGMGAVAGAVGGLFKVKGW